MTQTRRFLPNLSSPQDVFFPAGIWLASRLLIWIAMLLIAPNLPQPSSGIVPEFGWGVFDVWDSGWYRQIATTGYTYANDGGQHNIAFFPGFPLLIRGLMGVGLPFEIAGTMVNNLAFLLALYLVYGWVKTFHSVAAARWATAVLAWCPASLFAGVIYTEGLYLCLSTAALRAFDRQHYGWTAIWGACATATRPTGMALVPAFLLTAWFQRRPAIAYLSGLATASGILLFSGYCAVAFGDPLAFVRVQQGWRSAVGFDWQGWWKMLMQITIGTHNWQQGGIHDPFPPIAVAAILALAYWLWRSRHQLAARWVDVGLAVLALLWWIVAGDPLLNTVAVFGSLYLIWKLRTKLPLIATTYGFCGLALILASGGTMSLLRIVYGIVSPSLALGVVFSRYPRWGYMVMFFFAVLLALFSIRFAQHLWAG